MTGASAGTSSVSKSDCSTTCWWTSSPSVRKSTAELQLAPGAVVLRRQIGEAEVAGVELHLPGGAALLGLEVREAEMRGVEVGEPRALVLLPGQGRRPGSAGAGRAGRILEERLQLGDPGAREPVDHPFFPDEGVGSDGARGQLDAQLDAGEGPGLLLADDHVPGGRVGGHG